MVFLEAGLPQVNQTAYWRSVSCVDAVFTIQEVIAQVSGGQEQGVHVFV